MPLTSFGTVTRLLPTCELTSESWASRTRSAYDHEIVTSAQPLTTLRNTRVEADPRRVKQVLLGLGLASLAVASVALFVAGAHENAQITALKEHGLRVEDTVSGCLGQLGGSGSNVAGYSCTGTFSIGAHRYQEPIPGDAFYSPGTKLVIIADSEDPGLVTSVSALNSKRPSSTVFILPTILLLVLLGFAGTVVLKSRRRRKETGQVALEIPRYFLGLSAGRAVSSQEAGS
jgi:hypothetical protein